MANGKQPALTGIVQSAEKDPRKRKVLGRIALWTVEEKVGGFSLPRARRVR